jgi:hypothetical protein
MPDKPTPPSPSPVNLTGAMRHGLAVLLEAHEGAAIAQRSPWDFAIEREACHAAGLTDTDLRLLSYAGWVAHASERSLGKKQHLEQVGGQRIHLGPESCFILTPTGVAVAQGDGISLNSGTDFFTEVPVWDALSRELRFLGQTVKCFHQPAPDQELVLAAFQEQGWVTRIDDPLPPRHARNAKKRLWTTIKSLNRHQIHHLLHFGGDGTGTGVRWRGCYPSDTRALPQPGS